MGNTKLGITMIEMYANMIREEFTPILTSLRQNRKEVEEKVRSQILKDWGISALFIEREKLNERLKEINRVLAEYEKPNEYGQLGAGYNGYGSKIEFEVVRRMKEIPNPATTVEERQQGLIKQVKLAGVHEDVKTVFDALRHEMEALKSLIE